MSDTVKPVPTLTLSPEAAEKLKLEHAAAAIMEEAPPAAAAQAAVEAMDASLTDEDREAIARFAEQIDLMDPEHVMLYGADAQKKVSSFADRVLADARTGDSGDVGDMLVRLVAELKSFDGATEKPKGIRGLFSSAKRQIAEIKARFDSISVNVDAIAGSLNEHQIQLLKDINMFNTLYEMNLTYFRELTMYILAGEKRLKQVRETKLQELREIAKKTGDAMDAQRASDLDAQCDRFEKKLYDLKLTRQISLQMGPQIRLLQNNNALLVERIQSTLVNTLPLWKNQMVLALGMQHAQQAMRAQRAVTDMTNELLKKNADTLKQGTIETARESERGIVDIETLVSTNQSLIDTINEVIRIQDEGKQKRADAEKSLANMEQELKKKLLDM